MCFCVCVCVCVCLCVGVCVCVCVHELVLLQIMLDTTSAASCGVFGL